MKIERRQITSIFGKTGSGKSVLARHLIKRHKRWIIYDPMIEYDDMGIVVSSIAEYEGFLKRHGDKAFSLIYQPANASGGSEEDIDEFDEVAVTAFHAGNLVFCCEEMDLYCTTQRLPKGMANIVQRGRHQNISFIGISQRPFGVPRILTSQSFEICSFKQSEPRDIDYLSNYYGESTDKLKTLKDYKFLAWDDGKIILKKYNTVKDMLNVYELPSKEEQQDEVVPTWSKDGC